MSAARVLIVDDDPTVRSLFSLTLTHAGYAVTVAGDGESALEVVDRVAPDLIISELDLSGMDGLELVGHLHQRSAGRDVPIIFVTGTNPFGSAALILGRSGIGVLHKPCNLRRLHAAVERAINRRRVAVPLPA